MRYAVFIAFILCFAATASAQVKIGDDGLRVRLLRDVLGLSSVGAEVVGPVDAALVAAVAKDGGNTAANVRTLLARAGDGAVRAATWLDDGAWLTGTTAAQKATTIASLLDADSMTDVLQRAIDPSLPPVTARRGSPLRAMTGEPDDAALAAQHQARAAVATALWATFPIALRVRIETGAWPPTLTAAQIAALVAALRTIDVRALMPIIGFAPPGPAPEQTPRACVPRTGTESACRHDAPDGTAPGHYEGPFVVAEATHPLCVFHGSDARRAAEVFRCIAVMYLRAFDVRESL